MIVESALFDSSEPIEPPALTSTSAFVVFVPNILSAPPKTPLDIERLSELFARLASPTIPPKLMF